MQNKEIRKIVIRTPDLVPDQIATFGAIRFLKAELPEVNIEVICTSEFKNVYDYSGDVDKIHLIEQKKDSVLGVFPWIHNNSNLFGVDTFIDMHGGSAAATMGIALKAMRRIAYSTVLTKPMLTHSYSQEEKSEFSDTACLKLVSLIIDNEPPAILGSKAKDPNEKERQQLDMLGNYIFLAVRASEWKRHGKIWQDVINELDEVNFVVVIDQDIDTTEAIETLRSKKSEKLFLIEKAFARTDMLFMNNSKGVISDSCLYGNIASFNKIQAIILAFDLDDYPSFETYTPRPEIIIERAESVTTHIDSEGKKTEIKISDAVDIVNNKFNI